MQADIVPFPIGDMQGVPVLRARVQQGDPLTEETVVSMRVRARDGVQALWLETDRWDDPGWDGFLLKIVNDSLFGEMPNLAIRACSARHWPAVGLTWLIDISSTFSAPMSSTALRMSAAQMSAVPKLRELIWRNPSLELLTPGNLEAIFDAFSPQGYGWIYASDVDVRAQASKSAADAAARWGIRNEMESTWPS